MQNIKDFLEDKGIYFDVFDESRAVDIPSGKIYEIKDGQLSERDVKCTQDSGCEEQCQNCTSIRSYYANEQVVKLEYSSGAIKLIMSAPIAFEDRRIVIELIKDITSIMTVDMKGASRVGEVTRMMSNLSSMDTTDKLTGIMNRKFVDDRLQNIIESCKKIGKPVGIVLADIDRLAEVNKKFGNLSGDYVLIEIAKMFKGFVRREADFVARFDGGEFIFCFPGASRANCFSIAERIRGQVEMNMSDESNEIKATISMGVADSTEDGMAGAQELICAARERLKKAKVNGGNCVV